jgi:hypothetical protein
MLTVLVGRSLQVLAPQEDPIIIYMICVSDEPSALQDLCVLFTKIFDCYAAGVRGTVQPSDLVLKVLPLDILSYQEKMSFPSASRLSELSLEIYDRCPLKTSAVSPYATHSLVQLSPELPASISFKLTTGNVPSLLENECIANLAYCWDHDSSWLNAAWTDKLGCHAWSGCFYIDATHELALQFRAIVEEIIGVVIEGMEQPHGRPRILVMKDRDIDEIELGGTYSRRWPCFVMFRTYTFSLVNSGSGEGSRVVCSAFLGHQTGPSAPELADYDRQPRAWGNTCLRSCDSGRA